jgi:hypothetical protein
MMMLLLTMIRMTGLHTHSHTCTLMLQTTHAQVWHVAMMLLIAMIRMTGLHTRTCTHSCCGPHTLRCGMWPWGAARALLQRRSFAPVCGSLAGWC